MVDSRNCILLHYLLCSNVARPVTKRLRSEEVMHLAVVACGDRLDETLTMVKSALLFSLKRITFHIFAEDPLAPQFKEKVRNLRTEFFFTFWFILSVRLFSEYSDFCFNP